MTEKIEIDVKLPDGQTLRCEFPAGGLSKEKQWELVRAGLDVLSQLATIGRSKDALVLGSPDWVGPEHRVSRTLAELREGPSIHEIRTKYAEEKAVSQGASS